jgi:hypothetical protein
VIAPDADRRADADAVLAELLHGFWLIDHGRADEIVAGTSADVQVSGLGPKILDHGGLAAYGARRQADHTRHTRHVVTNFIAHPHGPDELASSCLLAVHALDADGTPQVSFFGEVEDVYVRDGTGRWLLARRSFMRFSG